MDKNAKKTGRLRRLILSMMGPSLSRSIIAFFLRRKIDRSQAGLPSGLNRSSDILFILPEDRLEMVFQLECLFTIIGRFGGSKFTFVCPAAHAPFVSALKGAYVIKYDPADFALYSSGFHKITAELANRAFDICVMLEKRYTLAHLYIIGMSRAHLRAGWSGAQAYPFLNLRIIPGGGENMTLWERNIEIAKLLDADTGKNVRWGVQKTTTEEVERLLGEYKINTEAPIICVDIASLESNCGKAWSAELLKSLSGVSAGQVCVFGGPEEEHRYFKGTKFPSLPPMSTPRTAALLAMTKLVITGTGALLGLAQISGCGIIPVLTDGDVKYYCKKNDMIKPVTFTQKPDDDAVKRILKNIRTLTA